MGDLIQRLRCGPCDIAFLPKNASVSTEELKASLAPEEWERSRFFLHPGRRDEYLRARYLFHVLSGCRDPLLNDEAGMPLWPRGFVGSISHKLGQVVVCVERTGGAAPGGVGIDLERVDSVTEQAAAKILSPSEANFLQQLADKNSLPVGHLWSLAFALKEAIFKCYYPLFRRRFYFEAVEIDAVDLQRQQLSFRWAIGFTPHVEVNDRGTAFLQWVAGENTCFVLVGVKILDTTGLIVFDRRDRE